MKKLLTLLILFSLGANAQDLHPQWAKYIHRTFPTFAYYDVTKADNNGNVYHALAFDTLTFGTHSYHSTTHHSAAVIKYNKAGTFQWSYIMNDNTPANELKDMLIAQDGSVYLTGFYTGTMDLGGGTVLDTFLGKGYTKMYVIKLKPDGSLSWAKGYSLYSNPTLFERPNNGIGINSAGYVMLLDAGGNSTFERRLNYDNSLLAESDATGGLYILTSDTLKLADTAIAPKYGGTGLGYNLIHLNSTMKMDWVKFVRHNYMSNYNNRKRTRAASNGTLYMGGYYMDTLYINDSAMLINGTTKERGFLSAILPNGTVQWIKQTDDNQPTGFFIIEMKKDAPVVYISNSTTSKVSFGGLKDKNNGIFELDNTGKALRYFHNFISANQGLAGMGYGAGLYYGAMSLISLKTYNVNGVTYTNAAKSQDVLVTQWDTAIVNSIAKSQAQIALECYPIPAKDQLILRTPLATTGVVEIFDIQGRRAYTATMHQEMSIPVSTWNKGFYMLRYTTKEGSVTKKIIIE